MSTLRSYNWNFYKTAVVVSIIFLFLLLIFLFSFGKNESFLIVNRYYHPSLDYFFQFVTYLGDGLIYIPLVLYGVFVNRKFLIPIILAIVFCTFLSQFSKRVIFPDALRPISLKTEEFNIRTIEGFDVHKRHSFPSGHTSTAFTLALLLSSIMRRKFWTLILPAIAFLVGYSRVYLSQHFIPDVAAGLVIGIISSFFALFLYERYLRKKEKQAQVIQ
jgi:membrane-associated phospholipid phosphatase